MKVRLLKRDRPLSASRKAGYLLLLAIAPLLAGLLLPAAASAMPQQQGIPDVNVTFGEGADATDLSLPLQLFLLITLLGFVPSIIIMMTSFTRIIIVFHFMRQAVATQTQPPNQVLAGMAFFLTLMIMWPVGVQVWDQAVAPYQAGEITVWQAFENAEQPVRGFMQKFIREKDLALFLEINNVQAASFEEVPLYIVVPAFMLSEVKTAFEIGFLLFLPFLVVDMVVASVLLGMGMIMLPPILISMPFKLLIFILVDGWYLIIGSLVKSFTLV